MLVKELRAARWAVLAALLIIASRVLDGGARRGPTARQKHCRAHPWASPRSLHLRWVAVG